MPVIAYSQQAGGKWEVPEDAGPLPQPGCILHVLRAVLWGHVLLSGVLDLAYIANSRAGCQCTLWQ